MEPPVPPIVRDGPPLDPPQEDGLQEIRQPNRPFDRRGPAWFLTYPQCPLRKEDLLEQLLDKLSGGLRPVYCVVAQEKHDDGSPHIHALVVYPSVRRIRSCRAFDWDGYHANIQPARSIADVDGYVRKGGDFCDYGTRPPPDSQPNRRSGRAEVLSTAIRGGASIQTLLQDHSGFLLLNLQKVRTFKSYVDAQPKDKEPWPELVDDITYVVPSNDNNRFVKLWLWSNIRKPRAFKQRQLWLHGGPDLGKTSLVNYLERFLRIYYFPLEETFHDLYDDDYDLIVLDEFNAQVTIAQLNKWLDGQRFNIRIKGGQMMKTKNIPVLILSNHSPAECYRNSNARVVFDALLTRISVIELDSPLFE